MKLGELSIQEKAATRTYQIRDQFRAYFKTESVYLMNDAFPLALHLISQTPSSSSALGTQKNLGTQVKRIMEDSGGKKFCQVILNLGTYPAVSLIFPKGDGRYQVEVENSQEILKKGTQLDLADFVKKQNITVKKLTVA